MNFYSVFGFAFATAVFYVGLRMSTDNMKVFLDYHGLLLVFGGTMAAAALSLQLNRCFVLFKIFFNRVFLGKKVNPQKIINNIIQIADKYRHGESLNDLAQKVDDPFLKECLELAHQGLLSPEELRETFMDRADKMMYHYSEEAKRVKNLCKYPPAFGLVGTMIGMIVMLLNLSGSDAMKMVGPAMSMCLVTTMYGIALNNFFLLPIADNLVDNAKETYLKNQIISDGARYILEKMNPLLISTKLNNYLLPSDRVDWKKSLGK